MFGGWLRRIERLEREWPEQGTFWRQSCYAIYAGARLMMFPAVVLILLMLSFLLAAQEPRP